MEVIVVEWNPFLDTPSLATLVRKPPESHLSVRIITVDKAFHDQHVLGSGQDFFEFMAKNVGARRARGKFILITNGDVILNDALFEMLASRRLQQDAFYRIARTDLPGMMDPLSPLAMRLSAVSELVEMLKPERTCARGEKECPGEYNRGICESGGALEGEARGRHEGDRDAAYLPAAGDFFLASREVFHRLGGYHQVPSTTHLDSLLVCKARGLGVRQVVLLQPCMMLHQRHPAPMQSLRYIYPGWELSEENCKAKEEEARSFMAGLGGEGRRGEEECGGSGASMNCEWGYPGERFREEEVGEAGAGDWQFLTHGGNNDEDVEVLVRDWSVNMHDRLKVIRNSLNSGVMADSIWKQMYVLALLRSVAAATAEQSRACSLEVYSRWQEDYPSMDIGDWYRMYGTKTCRDPVPMISPWEENRSAPTRGETCGAGLRDENLYLSIVASGRYDDLRGDFPGRLQNLIDITSALADAYLLPVEMIIVEWNPTYIYSGGKKHTVKLSDLLKKPENSSLAVRVVTVDQDFHLRSGGRGSANFLQFAAKNVGARRARGKFILITNGDVILNDALFEMLASRRLQQDAFYRIVRTDLPGMMDPLSPLAMRLSAVSELVEMLKPERTCARGEKECPGEYNRGICESGGALEGEARGRHEGDRDAAYLPAAGDFFLASREVFHRLGGYHQVPSTTHLDSLLVCKARGLGVRQVVLLQPCMMLHQRHPAPVPEMNYIHTGWELSEENCKAKEEEARSFMAGLGGEGRRGEEECGGSGASMNCEWGYPGERFREEEVGEARAGNWQHLSSSGYSDLVERLRKQGGALHSSDEAALKAGRKRSRGHEENFRVVFCVATTPQRVNQIGGVLDSIKGQDFHPDTIYLSLVDVVDVPKWILEDRRIHVITHPPTDGHSGDLGPIHKLLDCAGRENEANTAIITFDDDMILSPMLAGRLVQASKRWPEAAIGFSGWNVDKFKFRSPPSFEPEDFIGQHTPWNLLPSRVDVLEGYAGVIYRRGLLDLDGIATIVNGPQAARYADDVWISGFLSAWEIPRMVITVREEGPLEVKETGMSFKVMFGELWKHAELVTDRLRNHGDRALRNQRVVQHFDGLW
ncbi:hypothetical protein GUITHDRAFT_101120 [Guillardia theta CCMP2712]|uniref:Uncharacterized protein n=2 Tax=Guillardia theta TaxID=55529 RepID=L1JYI0_GUITC|nr:hypothetical protein GUITHDRAFT_101120 [Guillardia theta CCMP2712]EKX53417.1 hypothetical protein GUITHDRAFT_101120 [Guillardia theta CCMP2712]|eukprot:XP_005840397.1 hypothetical protein GUITHDRAFT_101120 [Guillardia theta CCMP2712]